MSETRLVLQSVLLANSAASEFSVGEEQVAFLELLDHKHADLSAVKVEFTNGHFALIPWHQVGALHYRPMTDEEAKSLAEEPTDEV